MLIVCFFTGFILSVRCARGAKHDFQILKDSKLKINEQAQIKADKGFQGLQKLFPRAQVPYKATKLKPLTKEERQANQQLARERIVIEHLNRECKLFRICQARYRGKHKNYERTWKLVAALVNLKRSTRHLKFATPELN